MSKYITREAVEWGWSFRFNGTEALTACSAIGRMDNTWAGGGLLHGAKYHLSVA